MIVMGHSAKFSSSVFCLVVFGHRVNYGSCNLKQLERGLDKTCMKQMYIRRALYLG